MGRGGSWRLPRIMMGAQLARIKLLSSGMQIPVSFSSTNSAHPPTQPPAIATQAISPLHFVSGGIENRGVAWGLGRYSPRPDNPKF
jgi:hypothetical protein